MRNEFTAIIERDGEWYIAYCPEIPGANGQGSTKDEARQSLAEAIAQSEGGWGGPPFDWDIMIDVGDLSGSQTPPDDPEGQEVVRQYAASPRHPREHFYNVAGNHDASGADEARQW